MTDTNQTLTIDQKSKNFTQEKPISSKAFQYDFDIVKKYGLLIGITLLGFYLLMEAVDLSQITSLRYLNVFLVFGGVFAALQAFFKQYKSNLTSYFSGLLMGISTAAIGILLFTVSFFLINGALFPAMGDKIVQSSPLLNTNIGMLSIVLSLEGLASGFMVSFASMQYFK